MFGTYDWNSLLTKNNQFYEPGVFDVAHTGGFNVNLITSVAESQLGLKAQRPAYSALGSEKGILTPTLDDAIDRYFSERCYVQKKPKLFGLRFL